MTQKKKAIVWHKKKNKFIDSVLIKPHQPAEGKGDSLVKMNRRQAFAKSLAQKIKNAVQKSSDQFS